MKTIRVMKIIIALSLTVVIFLCSSVFVSAYTSLFEKGSKDWQISTDKVYSAVYPEAIPSFKLEDKVYKHKKMNGETYFTSFFWDDNYKLYDDFSVDVPEVNWNTEVSAFGEDISTYDRFVVEYGNNLYLACIVGFNYVMLTDNNRLIIDVLNCTGEIIWFCLDFPYQSWKYYSSVDYYSDTGDLISPFITNEAGEQSIEKVLYSTMNIYDSTGTDVVHPKDSYNFFNTRWTVYYSDPVSMLTGALYLSVDAESLEKMSKTVSAFVFENMGYIIGTETSYIDISYEATFIQGDKFLGTFTVSDFNYNTMEESTYLTVGTFAVDSISEIVDYSDVDLTGSNIEICFTFNFVTDGYNLFFPGSVAIYEYANFQEYQQHNETLDTITESADEITGAIDSAANKLLYNQLGIQEIKLDNSGIDDYVADSDALMNDIYSDTDKLIQDNLPDGYNDYNSYLNDNIDYFNQNLGDAFSFVKDLFESFVDATGISYLILFCLSFGFAMYVLGRRLT